MHRARTASTDEIKACRHPFMLAKARSPEGNHQAWLYTNQSNGSGWFHQVINPSKAPGIHSTATIGRRPKLNWVKDRWISRYFIGQVDNSSNIPPKIRSFRPKLASFIIAFSSRLESSTAIYMQYSPHLKSLIHRFHHLFHRFIHL